MGFVVRVGVIKTYGAAGTISSTLVRRAACRWGICCCKVMLGERSVVQPMTVLETVTEHACVLVSSG